MTLAASSPTLPPESEANQEFLLVNILPIDDALLPAERPRVHAQTSYAPISTLSVEIAENSAPGCGGIIWPSASILIRHVLYRLEQDPFWLRGMRVLELGAGTGVVGLAIAKANLGTDMSMDKMILTDLSELCPLMRENTRLNGMQPALDNGTLAVLELPWGAPFSGFLQDLMPVDVVLISDCVYLESCFDLLLDTIDRLLTTPETVAIMSYKRRRRAEKRFFLQLRKRFDVKLVILIYFMFLLWY